MTPKKRSILAPQPPTLLAFILVFLVVAAFIKAGHAAASAGGTAATAGDSPAADNCAAIRCPNPPPPPSSGDCSITSVGLTPLIDMGRETYQGFTGGLYHHSNEVPESHFGFGLAAGHDVRPRNPQGQPNDTNGRIVFLGVGMSNVKQEFGSFIRIVGDQTPGSVVLVNGGQAGYDAPAIADPHSDYWDIVDQRLNERSVTRQQVQVIWLKGATSNEDRPFPQDALALKGYLRDIVLIAKNRFPHLQAIYFSSRIYGGYAGSNPISPEPFAYQGAFAIKWLIEDQVNGSDPALNYNSAPWLAWGPYMWADGLNPRSDGLIWRCEDFDNDGIHPSAIGEEKVAQQLKAFFQSDPTTTLWFVP